MKPMYYDEYFKANEITYERGKYNIVRTPCGSGKTFHCLNVITANYDGEYGRRFGTCDCYRCLYVTDTSALKESVIDSYLRQTGRKKVNIRNLEVLTYAKLGRQIELQGIEAIAQTYDYIFLDEIHQLFVYEEKYDGDDDDAYYGLVIDSLEELVRLDTTLICLSATPNKLLDYIRDEIGKGEFNRVKDIVPISELHKIKSYVNRYDIPVFDVSQAISEINIEADDKIFIFAHTIKELQQLEEQCLERGWSVASLWSINQNRKYDRVKRDIKEAKDDNELAELQDELLKCKPMNDYQLAVRNKLITTGEFDTQVLILNASYESGINIENDKDSRQRTIHVIVASTEEHTIVQARGRIRHDIDCLWHLSSDMYDCITSSSGVDNNKNLVKRLEQLASECEQDEYTFVGNEGRKKISNVLQLYTIYEKNGKQYRKQAKSVDAMNNVLMLRDLPFRIEQRKERKRVNGKVKEFSIYIVIDKRKEN